MTINVRLFAILRERAGRDSLDVELPAGATVADALAAVEREAQLGNLLARLPVRAAVNREYASTDTRLSPGDEVALIPPVSGGAGPQTETEADIHVRVTDEPLDAGRLAAGVSRPGAGAIVTFQGTTREVERLEYEAYAEMAEERIAAILRDCVERNGLEAAAAEHRTGPVPLGETSVVVAVSAPHRPEAFAGAREAIDRIKADAPIWKREVDGGQAHWVKSEGAAP